MHSIYEVYSTLDHACILSIVFTSTVFCIRRRTGRQAGQWVGGVVPEVRWYPGLVLGNWKGMAEDEFVEYGTLGDFIEDVWGPGIDLVEKYRCTTSPGDYRMWFRDVMHELTGVNRWYEITSGRSLRGYRAIDVYMHIGSYPKQPEEEEAWYLLNVMQPPDARRRIPPEQWYRSLEWVSYGQKKAIDRWYITLPSRL